MAQWVSSSEQHFRKSARAAQYYNIYRYCDIAS